MCKDDVINGDIERLFSLKVICRKYFIMNWLVERGEGEGIMHLRSGSESEDGNWTAFFQGGAQNYFAIITSTRGTAY